MLAWSLIFLIIAIIAGLLGFRGVATTATKIAKILFVIFLILLLSSLVLYGIGIHPVLLTWGFVFLAIAFIAAVLGFPGVAVLSVDVAKIIFIIFLVLFVFALVGHFFVGPQVIVPQMKE